MRHGETFNNLLAAISPEAYNSRRVNEPPMSKQGKESTLLTGQKMKELGFSFDKIICAAHYRSLESAKLLRQGFGNETLPIELFLKCHEIGGVYEGDRMFPGLTKK